MLRRETAPAQIAATMKIGLTPLLLVLLLCTKIGHASNTVEGIVYLNDGTKMEIADSDRIRLPRGHRALQILRDAFRKKTHETIAFERIDSIVCWHAQSPGHRRKFLPASACGWAYVYLETPEIRVAIAAGKGYGIASNGGIRFYRRKSLLRSAETDYYVEKRDGEFHRLGALDRRANDRFRRRVARLVEDDPSTAERILRSSTSRSKTVLLLQHYTPQKD